jgi:hypothetical protein
MQSPKRYLETISNDNEYDLPDPKSPGEFADRFGIRASLVILCVGLFIAALWMVSRPSFEKCLGLENANERHACYDELRAESLKPPAKGGEAPAAALRSPQ